MNSESRRKRILMLHGGWEGHEPDHAAEFAAMQIFPDFDVFRSNNLDDLQAERSGEFDLLVPIWTFGELTDEQESGLLQAVADGLGVLAWHGAASSFLASRPYKFMLGGQFVGHPGGPDVRYTVRFLGNDPIVEGLEDFTLESEQYYLLVDPAVKIVASSRIEGEGMPWLAGVEMPVAWTRRWGRGRVFYCSLGHTLKVLSHPTVEMLLRRAAFWASRDAQDGSV